MVRAMASRPLNPSERLDWLRLIRTENVGPVTFYQLLSRFGSAGAALEALPGLATRGGRHVPLAPYPKSFAERELAVAEKAGIALIAWGEPDYPEALAAVDDAPPLIALRGRRELLRRRAIAIVGARNASANGRRLARDIAGDLGQHGLAVASGLARGIDAAAHLGALPSGTVAVVAGGVDIVYPEENRELYEAIAENGAIIAEPPLRTVPQARHFPRRNRLISGLALGVVVVEAAARSGSLITARYALDQGRDIFAVPGSPLDPRCRGTNDLIRRGAHLTESAEDVLQQYSNETLAPRRSPASPPLSIDRRAPPDTAEGVD
jgi:DNA processing protein